jgi:uncharacterized protein RhaS with RHS repeats
MNYNSDVQVASLVDANGNVTEFHYDCPDATEVIIKNGQGTVEKQWLASFDPENGNMNAGTTDAQGSSVSYYYDDSDNPGKPTKIVSPTGAETLISYDDFGNVLTVTNPRGTATSFAYDYIYLRQPGQCADQSVAWKQRNYSHHDNI